MTKDLKLDKSAAAPKKRKKIASLDRRKARAGWFFVLPFILGFVLIYLPMIYDSIVMSLSEIHMAEAGVGGYTLEFVGLKNYVNAFSSDPLFAKRLVEGLETLAFDIPAILIFSLFMAVMLNQKMAGRAVFRSIFFVPVIISTGIMETIAAQDILNNYMGSTDGIDDGSGSSAASELVSSMDLQMLFANMKVGTEIVDYVVTAINNIFNIVNRSGVQMLIFLSALQSINPAIYESCKIDGATSWETFWKITFPMISPMILVNGIYTIIDSFTNSQNVVMAYISETYSKGSEVLSSAMAWIYFLIVIVVVAIIGAIFSAFVFYGRKSE
ncbi:MAG: sugar ABC transporter permease [Clostridia bacterium]|nr:sugar ABC transporter permease [Clostridia bacterium]